MENEATLSPIYETCGLPDSPNCEAPSGVHVPTLSSSDLPESAFCVHHSPLFEKVPTLKWGLDHFVQKFNEWNDCNYEEQLPYCEPDRQNADKYRHFAASGSVASIVGHGMRGQGSDDDPWLAAECDIFTRKGDRLTCKLSRSCMLLSCMSGFCSTCLQRSHKLSIMRPLKQGGCSYYACSNNKSQLTKNIYTVKDAREQGFYNDAFKGSANTQDSRLDKRRYGIGYRPQPFGLQYR